MQTVHANTQLPIHTDMNKQKDVKVWQAGNVQAGGVKVICTIRSR